MDLINAIERRISCRAYADVPLTADEFGRIGAMVAEVNAASGLGIQLLGPRGDGRTAVDLSAAMFAGPVYACLAIVGPDDPVTGEKLGYWGEELVLQLTAMGLGTCWVAGTYNRDTLQIRLGAGDRLWDIIPVGYPPKSMPLKQRTIRAGIRARSKKPEQMVQSDVPYAQLPEWFRAAVAAVGKGPSAINRQPVVFHWRDGAVTATLSSTRSGLEYNDLGIAKRHFEIAASAGGIDGRWGFGDGAAFAYEP